MNNGFFHFWPWHITANSLTCHGAGHDTAGHGAAWRRTWRNGQGAFQRHCLSLSRDAMSHGPGSRRRRQPEDVVLVAAGRYMGKMECQLSFAIIAYDFLEKTRPEMMMIYHCFQV